MGRAAGSASSEPRTSIRWHARRARGYDRTFRPGARPRVRPGLLEPTGTAAVSPDALCGRGLRSGRPPYRTGRARLVPRPIDLGGREDGEPELDQAVARGKVRRRDQYHGAPLARPDKPSAIVPGPGAAPPFRRCLPQRGLDTVGTRGPATPPTRPAGPDDTETEDRPASRQGCVAPVVARRCQCPGTGSELRRTSAASGAASEGQAPPVGGPDPCTSSSWVPHGRGRLAERRGACLVRPTVNWCSRPPSSSSQGIGTTPRPQRSGSSRGEGFRPAEPESPGPARTRPISTEESCPHL